MNPNTKTTNTKSFSPRPSDKNINTKYLFLLIIKPKKMLIKGKERKIFESLDIPLEG